MPSRPKRKPAARRPAPPPKQPPWLWIGAGAIVVLAAVIAIVVTLGGDGGSTATEPGIEQTRPVEVDGTPLPTLDDPASDPAVGTLAPELRGASFDGTPVTVTHDGRPKLLLFVAHWCPHCQREVPLLGEHLAANPLPAGIDLVTIATSTSPDQGNYPPSAWLAREGWSAPVLADSDAAAAARAFGLSAFPYFVALDASGKVVARTTGEISTETFDQLARQALG